MISPSRIAIVTGILFFLEGVCGYIFSPILLMLSKNTDTLIYSSIILNISSLILFAWSRPKEGVKFYLTHERFAEAKEEAHRIAEFNSKSAEKIIEAINLYERDLREGKETGKSKDMVNTNHYYKWRNLIFMVICWIATCYSYFIFVYLIKYLPADIYIVDLVSGFSAIGFLI